MTFQSILQDIGIDLSTSNVTEGFELKEPKPISQLLNQRFQRNEQDMESFVQGFFSFIDPPNIFVKATLPWKCIQSRDLIQESLMKCLLNVEMIQTQIIECLLEKLPEYSNIASEIPGVNLPMLLLNQLRWIDYVVDPQQLSATLLVCLEACPLVVQREIISIIPEVIGDEDREMVMRKLQEMMQVEQSLTVSILDTLTGLNLPSFLLSECVQSILPLLDSSNLEDLPIIVKFLVRSATPDNMHTIIAELRDKLQFNWQNMMQSNDIETLVYQTLLQELRFRNDVVSGFLKGIVGCCQYQNHRILDLWILYGLYSISRYRKETESILKRKISNGLFTKSLFVKSIVKHGNALQCVFTNLLDVAGTLLHTNSSVIAQQYGILLYELAVDTFTSVARRQDVIDALIIHSGSAVGTEVDCALDTLVSLVKPSPSYMPSMVDASRCLALSPFLPFLQQLLDFVDKFTDNQIRKVYEVLCNIAHQGSVGLDQLNTIINKQLSHPEVHYRRLGIMGKIIMLQLESATIEHLDSSNEIPFEHTKGIQETIDDLIKACGHQSHCLSFLYDECTRSIQMKKLGQAVVQIISESFSVELESHFFEDYNSDPAVADEYVKPVLNASLRTAIWKDLDGDEAKLYMRLATLATSKDPVDRDSLNYVCALIRLLAACEQALSNGDLDGIEAVLGCPILFVEMSYLDNIATASQDTQNTICLMLWHTINWFRELINAFSTQNDSIMQNKVVKRLQHVLEFEEYFDGVLESVTSPFLPPNVEKPSAPSSKQKEKQVDQINVKQSFREYHPLVPRVLAFSALQLLSKNDIQEVLPLIQLILSEISKQLSNFLSEKRKISPFGRGESNQKKSEYAEQFKGESLLSAYIDDVFPAVQFHLVCLHQTIHTISPAKRQYANSIFRNYFQICETIANSTALQSTHQGKLLKKKSLSTLLLLPNHVQESTLLPALMEFNDQNTISELPIAVVFLNACEAIVRFTKQNFDVLSDTAHMFLQRQWINKEATKQRYKAVDLQYFVSVYLQYAKSPLNAVKHLVFQAMEPLIENKGTVSSVAYPTLYSSTEVFYYRPLIERVVSYVQKIDYNPGVNNPKDVICHLRQATLLLKLLVGLTKCFQKKVIIASVLKYGRIYLESILKAMPFFQDNFRHYIDPISDFIKDLQAITRRLQTLCAHGKIVKDKTSINQIPMVKKLLETLIYRIEALVESHNAYSAYSTGVLKNRRIDGTAIRQEDLDAEQAEEEDEEEEEEGEEEEEEEEEENED